MYAVMHVFRFYYDCPFTQPGFTSFAWFLRKQRPLKSQLWGTTDQWTVPQLSIMIIYNSAWSILIQWIRDILSGNNLT